MNLLASGVNSFYGGYGYGGYGYMFDWTYLLIIAGTGTFPDCFFQCKEYI